MRIKLLFFASVREELGVATEALELPAAVTTVAALREHLRTRGPKWEATLGSCRAVRVALDQVIVQADSQLRDGAEVAFFPPVTGG